MKLKYVDVLRGLAIFGVLVAHCSHYGINKFPSFVSGLIENGARGVQLFYIASAFTLFLSMSKRYDNEKYPKWNFFIRRFFRIAPMYYVAICYYLWEDGFGPRYWLANAHCITFNNILSNVIFVNGFNPYWINSVVPGGWSVAIEMLFYCLLPLLFLKIKNTQNAFIFVIVTLVMNVVTHYFLIRFQLIESERLWSEYLFLFLPCQLPIFALGILFYFIIKDNYNLKISPILIVLSSVIMLSQFSGIRILPGHFLFGTAFVILGIALSKYEFKVLVNPVIVHIGKISYSMYLVHFAILYWLDKINFVNYLMVTNYFSGLLNYGIRLLLLLGITTVISTVFYRFVELPMQMLGRKLIVKLNK